MASTAGSDLDDLADACDRASMEAHNSLRVEWARCRVRLAADIEEAIAEVRRSFEASTSVKIGGSVVAVVGGVASVVGFALLVTSLGAALPLAIAGTVTAIGGGVGGGAAALGHAAVQSGITKRVRRNFDASRRLMDQVLDQLAAAMLTEAKRSVRLHKDVSLSCRICRLLDRLLAELLTCRQLHTRLLSEAGMAEPDVAGLPAAKCAQRLAALIQAARDFAVDRLAADFIGHRSPTGGTEAWQAGEQCKHRSKQGRNESSLSRVSARRSKGGEVELGQKVRTSGEGQPAGGGELRQRASRTGSNRNPRWQHLRHSELSPLRLAIDALSHGRGGPEESERKRLLNSLTGSANLLISLVRVSLFGSADAGNLPCGEAVAVSLKSTLHYNIGLAEGVVQGVGKASALSVTHILGTAVGSVASTALDAGLLIYYSKQLHDFKRKGRNPQLVDQLQAMKLTVQLQLGEVLNLCCLSGEKVVNRA